MSLLQDNRRGKNLLRVACFHTFRAQAMSNSAATTSRASVGAAPAKELEQLSPAMRQYRQFKEQYPGYILFFRMGDFYEMFWDDAVTSAKTLGLTLTSRNKGAPDE